MVEWQERSTHSIFPNSLGVTTPGLFAYPHPRLKLTIIVRNIEIRPST
ncbi:hypothetical protein ABIE28_000559 [Devosia sp. 2618]